MEVQKRRNLGLILRSQEDEEKPAEEIKKQTVRQYETKSMVSLKTNEEEFQEKGSGLSVRNAAESKDRIVKSPLDGAIWWSGKTSTRTISVYCGINSTIGVGLEKGIGGKKVETECLTALSKSFAVKGSKIMGAGTERGYRVNGGVEKRPSHDVTAAGHMSWTQSLMEIAFYNPPLVASSSSSTFIQREISTPPLPPITCWFLDVVQT